MPGEARGIMSPSLPSNGRDRQTTMRGTPRGSTMCAHSVEGETQRAVTRSKQRLLSGCKAGTIGIEEGEQESRSPRCYGSLALLNDTRMTLDMPVQKSFNGELTRNAETVARRAR